MESDVNARAFNLTSRVLLAVAAVVVIAVLARDLHVVRLTSRSLIDYPDRQGDGALRDSVHKLQQAAAESPDTYPLRALGLLYVRAGRPGTAIRYFTEVLRLEPADRAVWYSLAITASPVHHRLYESAISHLRALDPKYR